MDTFITARRGILNGIVIGIFTFLTILFGSFTMGSNCDFAMGAEISQNCIKSVEICENGIDEDCSGIDLPCPKCKTKIIPTSGCYCSGEKRYYGYCCDDTWQSTPCEGKVYYLDVNGNDSNKGSQFEPWKSFHYAIGEVKAGDTVLINPGKYFIKKQISIRTSGKKEQPITFRGNGEGVTIDFSECPKGNGFEIHLASYIIIENLTIHAPKIKHSRCIRLTHSIGSIIRNNTVYGAGHANLFCSLSDHTTFENNEAYDGQIGIYVSDSSDYVTVRSNVLHGNSQIGLHMNGDRRSGDGIVSYAIVENNTIYNNDTGINVDGVTESVFRNNLLYNNRKKGIAFFKGDGAVPSNDNLVIHNTIIMPKGANYAVGLNYGAYRNTFFNNIIFTEGGVPCFSTTAKIGDLQVVSDYNLFSKDGRIWEIGDEAYRFGKWQRKLSEIAHKTSRFVTGQSSGNDRHSVQARIGETFARNTKGDFRLSASSPAIDKGISTHSFGKDLIGNPRPNGCCPDMGAYEYHERMSSKIGRNKGETLEAKNSILTSKTNKTHKRGKVGSVKKKTLRNKLGMEFSFIPPGSFKMGARVPDEETGESSRLHQVNLTNGFYMQITEVTQGQWKKLMEKNPSYFGQCGDDCPVEQVTWNYIQEFIRRLNVLESTNKYRLPTEAEWEYACRAGTDTPFSFGKCLTTEQANYNGNYPLGSCQKGQYSKRPISVKSFPPNAWGLRGMYGNVWEWCQDWLGEYSENTETDPLGSPTGSLRVIRGGGWNSYAKACRSGNRGGCDPAKWFGNLGFRLIKEP